MNKSFFSVPFHLISLGRPLPYDIYVNSSSNKDKEKFVRVFPLGEILNETDMERAQEKYHQLYLSEMQRAFYLQSLVQSSHLPDKDKTTVIKDSAILYLGKLFDQNKEFSTEVLDETLEGCKDSVESMVKVIKDYDVSQIQDLIGSLSFHDFYTYDHSINVSMYCISLLKAVRPNAPEKELVIAGMGGLLHDLGKIKIPTEIINSPDKLTDEQFDLIKQHPGYGKELLEEHQNCSHVEDVDYELIKRVVYEHHENFNGTGYPSKLKGEEIHFLARITAIADFFDAITTKRSYADVLSVEDAIHVMEKTRGTKLDPKLFDVFVKHAKVLLKKGKNHLQLVEDFDPCQPHQELPLEEVKHIKESEDFGKIRVVDGLKPKKKAA